MQAAHAEGYTVAGLDIAHQVREVSWLKSQVFIYQGCDKVVVWEFLHQQY